MTAFLLNMLRRGEKNRKGKKLCLLEALNAGNKQGMNKEDMLNLAAGFPLHLGLGVKGREIP